MKIESKELQILLKPGNLTRHLALDEKRRMYVREHFMSAGMSQYRFYNRCLTTGDGSGFDEWEIRGLYRCIDDFCVERGLPICPDEKKSSFYDTLDGHKAAFHLFMHPLGMCKVTLINRFGHWNFAEWELRGVCAIVEQICASEC